MPFKVGDKVVYPHHGAAVIEGTDTITMPDGAKAKYFVLRMTHGDLLLKVPADRAEDIGMRYPISKEDVEDVFEVLAKKDVREPTNWSRRFKNHQEKLKSGDIYECAEVVRNLALRQQNASLSTAEKLMYANARHIMISELAVSWGVEDEEAELRVDAALGLVGKAS